MAKERTNIFFILCFLAVLILSGCRDKEEEPTGAGSQTAKVVISPASGAVPLGSTFTRTVDVRDVKNVFFSAFDVAYDPKVIEFVMPAEEGTFLNKSVPHSTSMQVALQNAAQGRVVVGLTRLGPIGDVSGDGTLLTLTFKAVGPGATTLAFTNPKGLKNSANQDVAIGAWEDGTVTVQ